jgi:hypothetical protein
LLLAVIGDGDIKFAKFVKVSNYDVARLGSAGGGNNGRCTVDSGAFIEQYT